MRDVSVAIVTGASRGLGLALTRELVARGWKVVLDARDGSALGKVTEGLEGVVCRVMWPTHAVPEQTDRLVNAAHTWGGRVIAVGTTVVRALETAAAPTASWRPAPTGRSS